MGRKARERTVAALALAGLLLAGGRAGAGQVAVERVELERAGGTWNVSVTLRHADTGWEHYADAWRIVDAQGRELARRVLLHPHVHEQPFTRSLSGVRLPERGVVHVEAHDTVHGWSPDRVAVDLGRDAGPRYRIRR